MRASTPGRRADELIYLIAPSGYPNYGDELIARTWLLHLARVRPEATVVLDCHSPGSAAVLLRDVHPRLLVVDTLWQLTTYAAGSEADAPWDWVMRAALDAGLAPRLAAGIELLDEAMTIHLIGGGYVNDVWPHHISLVAAAAAVTRRSGAQLVATGQGLLPTPTGHAWEVLVGALEAFDMVDVRDSASAAALDGYDGVAVRHSGDDAWLAFDRPTHPLYETADPGSPYEADGVVLCLQSDLTDRFRGPASTGIDALTGFVRATLDAWEVPGAAVTVVEGIPGHDFEVPTRLGDRLRDARVRPFAEIWRDGLPAGRAQTWISTRFHLHLMAAAAGDPGVAIAAMPTYYSTKHQSLLDAGSPWTLADSGMVIPERPTAGGVDDAHRTHAIEAKVATADQLYPG